MTPENDARLLPILIIISQDFFIDFENKTYMSLILLHLPISIEQSKVAHPVSYSVSWWWLTWVHSSQQRQVVRLRTPQITLMSLFREEASVFSEKSAKVELVA